MDTIIILTLMGLFMGFLRLDRRRHRVRRESVLGAWPVTDRSIIYDLLREFEVWGILVLHD